MTALGHPLWCDLKHCDGADPDVPAGDDGMHRSTPLPLSIPLADDGTLNLRVQLLRPVTGWSTRVVAEIQDVATGRRTPIAVPVLSAVIADVLPVLALAWSGHNTGGAC